MCGHDVTRTSRIFAGHHVFLFYHNGRAMKQFPALCVDNFYSDPDKVRAYALAQSYDKPENGSHPGKRSGELMDLNGDLYTTFCNRLFSIFYDGRKTKASWIVSTSFQLIEPYEHSAQSVKNRGWIHVDNKDVILAGVVYLTPHINEHCGTSLYELVDPSLCETSDAKRKYFVNSIDDNYDHVLTRSNSAFKETVRFNNIYNRMICFDSQTFHGINSFYTEKEPRLTQAFFVVSLETDSGMPLERMRRINERVGA